MCAQYCAKRKKKSERENGEKKVKVCFIGLKIGGSEEVFFSCASFFESNKNFTEGIKKQNEKERKRRVSEDFKGLNVCGIFHREQPANS